MGEAGQEGVEIGGAGSDEADGGSEAGQDDDESQKETAHRSEIERRSPYQHRRPVFHVAQHGHRRGAQGAEGGVNEEHEERGNETGLQGSASDFTIGRQAVETDGFHHDDAEHQACQTVHGIVALQQSRRKGLHRRVISRRRRLPASHGQEKRSGDEDEKEREKHGRNALADAGHQLGRADGQIPGKKEEKKYKSVKPQVPCVSRKEMGNGDFIGHRGSPGNGKERSDGQVQGAAEKNAVQRAHPSGQLPRGCQEFCVFRLTNRI